jgi:DNA-binding protein Fis
MTGQQIFDYAADKGMNLGNRNLNLKSKYIPENVEVAVGEDIVEKPFSEILRSEGFQTYQDPNEEYLGKGDTQGEIGDTNLGEGRTFSEDFGTTEQIKKNLEKKIDDTTKVEEVSFSADADGDVTTVDENDLDSLIDRYYKQLGGDKAARRYGEDVLGTVSASLLEGKGFRGALADAVKVKSDAPKIKQAAAMLGIKGEQAQKLYETKLKNVKGPFTQKVEEIMQSRNVDRDRATRMALGESGTLGEAFVSYKNKTGMPPTPTDFDAIAEGFTLGALPEDFSTSKPTGTFYIPGEMVIVEMEEGVQKSIKSYKS